MYALANASKRIDIENRGFSYEGRPLVLLTITSEENHDKLIKFKRSHIDYIDGKSDNKSSNFYSRPVVIYQGYSIHGNEPSGTNAAMLARFQAILLPEILPWSKPKQSWWH